MIFRLIPVFKASQRHNPCARMRKWVFESVTKDSCDGSRNVRNLHGENDCDAVTVQRHAALLDVAVRFEPGTD